MLFGLKERRKLRPSIHFRSPNVEDFCHFSGHMSLIDKPEGLLRIMHPFHQHSKAD